MTNVCLFFKIFLKKLPYFSKPQIFLIIAFSLLFTTLVIASVARQSLLFVIAAQRGNLFAPFVIASVARQSLLPARDSHATLRSAQNDSGRAFVIPSVGDSPRALRHIGLFGHSPNRAQASGAYLLSMHASTYYNSPKNLFGIIAFFYKSWYNDYV